MATEPTQQTEQQANWQTLWCLFGNLPLFVSLDIRQEGGAFKIEIKAPNLDAKATIRGGNLLECTIPPKTNGSYNSALMAQFLMMVQPETDQTFNIRLLATMIGCVGLHDYEGGRKVLSLSNHKGLAVKFVVKDVSLPEMEQYLRNPTNELVVVHTTGTPFAGVIGHLILSTANTAYIRVGEEILCVPTDRWTFLLNILPMF